MTEWRRLMAMHQSPLGTTHSGPQEDCVSAQCGPNRFARYVAADEAQNRELSERVAPWANGGTVENLPPTGLDGPCVFPRKRASRDTVVIELDQSEAASVVDALISAADTRRDKKGRLHEVIADYLDDLAIRIHEARGVSEGHSQ